MLTLEEGSTVVKLARSAIEEYLKNGEKPDPPEELSEEMKGDRGVFVTLNKNGRLRGCIGRPLPTQPLMEGVVDSAISAATKDPRFSSMSLEELDDVAIEVSVMTVPEIINVENPKNYPEKIKVGRDGLIAEYEGRKGLLLPQVPVDQGWDAEEFLSQTCIKAGLPPDTWLKDGFEVRKFTAQIFKENKPGGDVVEKTLSS